MLVYAVTIFLSAFLLFQVQPLIAKFILPWFGGSAAVWSAALLFFQLMLLAGYFYAYVVIRYLETQTAVLGARRPSRDQPGDAAHHSFADIQGDRRRRIPRRASCCCWSPPWDCLTRCSPPPVRCCRPGSCARAKARSLTGLFALSNFGSMLALLSYPTLVEPRMALHSQAVAWSWGFAAFAAVCVLAAWKSKDGVDPAPEKAAGDAPGPTLADKLLWIGLAACASILLLAVTSHLTQNVAPIPLLWVVPLSLYLLSFILCFESDRLYPRWLFLPLLAVALGVFTWGISLYEGNYRDQAIDSRAVRSVVRLLHGVSRRAVAAAAASALSHAVLSDGLGGRGAGRILRRVRFAAAVPRLSGTAGRPGRLRGAGYLRPVEPPDRRAAGAVDSSRRWRWRPSPSPVTWASPR